MIRLFIYSNERSESLSFKAVYEDIHSQRQKYINKDDVKK